MAKYGTGGIVGEIRNKLGGVVFTKAKNGSSIRVRIKPNNPRSAAQTTARNHLVQAARAYKALAANKVALWQAYADGITKYDGITGSTYHPSAIMLFIALAAKYLAVTPAGTIPDEPPATPFEGDTATITAAGGTGKITFTASGANGTGITSELLVQKIAAPNRRPAPKGYRTKAFNAFAGGSLTHDVTLAAGVYVPAYKFVLDATGEQTQIVVLPVVTVS